jgi:ferredoxin--NADP+ reductase
VGWYNGHPDYADLRFDLSCPRAVVIGNGNVALDVARILCSPVERLAKTDIADHALAALSTSNITEVLVVGRRGAAHAAFTTPELKELPELTASRVDVHPDEVVEVPGEEVLAKSARRNLSVLRDYAADNGDLGDRHVTLRFQRSPIELLGDGRVEELVLGHNDLRTDAGGQVLAHDTGARESVRTGLVLRAVGYRGLAIAGLPFDAGRGIIPNHTGRVCDTERDYVVGWIKRGPSGVIGTTRRTPSKPSPS